MSSAMKMFQISCSLGSRIALRAFQSSLRGLVAAAALAFTAFLPMQQAIAQAPAASKAAPELRIQLNQLEQRDDMCLAYFLLHNVSGHGLKDLQTELFVFDRGGVVAAHLRASFPDVRENKTVIKLFRLGSVNRCDQVGGILINDVAVCETTDGAALDCLGVMSTSSKSDVRLFK
jgi:hypothetical protein